MSALHRLHVRYQPLVFSARPRNHLYQTNRGSVVFTASHSGNVHCQQPDFSVLFYGLSELVIGKKTICVDGIHRNSKLSHIVNILEREECVGGLPPEHRLHFHAERNAVEVSFSHLILHLFQRIISFANRKLVRKSYNSIVIPAHHILEVRFKLCP